MLAKKVTYFRFWLLLHTPCCFFNYMTLCLYVSPYLQSNIIAWLVLRIFSLWLCIILNRFPVWFLSVHQFREHRCWGYWPRILWPPGKSRWTPVCLPSQLQAMTDALCTGGKIHKTESNIHISSIKKNNNCVLSCILSLWYKRSHLSLKDFDADDNMVVRNAVTKVA